MMKLTASRVRSLLEYDPVSGDLTWKRRVKVRWGWNEAFAGKKAGSKGQTGHIKISIDDRTYLAHRLIWLLVTGKLPVNEIDHANGYPDDNRWINLREATRQQNQQNRGLHKSNTTGFKGVCKCRKTGRWYAQIYRLGKKVHLGTFAKAEIAHAAYCKAASENYGNFVNLGSGA